ncbi:histidine phosphatase superfamily [Nemania abortiva]|nr:histidine phosphatase superfamily [Nemania abortiva]
MFTTSLDHSPQWLRIGILLLSTQICSATLLYSTYRFNPLEHLGGVAPYFEPQDPPASPSAPQGCAPVRAAYLSRHAAIYANDFDYEEYLEPFISKLENHTGIDWTKIPTLNFLAGWTAPITDAEQELLTRVGKVEAAQLGATLSFRYPNLKLPAHVWTSSAERTYKSAQSLVRGLETDDNGIRVISIYESEKAGANSLTPYKSCPAYSSSAGSDQSSVYLEKFTAPIVARLDALAPEFNFTSNDVYGMMELCGYESVIRGRSPFCDLGLFSPDDWLGWEYTADIQYHYNVGYGNRVSGFVGLPWLNATASLLLGSHGDEDMYVSFTHRELPPMVAVAMGLFNNSAFGGSEAAVNDTMPLDRINYRRAWKSSHLLPFLGNLAIERLDCKGTYGYDDGEYYRVLVNSAPQPLPDCADGPGASCSRSGFERYVQDRVDMFRGFSERCGVDYDNSTDVLSIYTNPDLGNGTLTYCMYLCILVVSSSSARVPGIMSALLCSAPLRSVLFCSVQLSYPSLALNKAAVGNEHLKRASQETMAPRTSIAECRELVDSSNRILVLCGAGLSAASGLPTFRGAGGLWRNHEPTSLATPAAFKADPALVWLFYAWRKHMALGAQPNPGHYALAEMAKKKENFLCLTQNVDGLSPRAGHPEEKLRLLHGSILDIKCFDECGYAERHNLADPLCPALAPASEDYPPDQTMPLLDPNIPTPKIELHALPHCPNCKTGLLRPGVVWFEEALDSDMLNEIDEWIARDRIDLMIVVGTSSAVFPAAGYAYDAQQMGAIIAVVNPDPDSAEDLTSDDFFFQADAAEVLPLLFEGVIGTMDENGQFGGK